MKYVLIPDNLSEPLQILDLPKEVTAEEIRELLKCELLDHFSFRSFYIVCDDSGAGVRPHNVVASVCFERDVFGPVLVGALYDFHKTAFTAEAGFYPLSILDLSHLLRLLAKCYRPSELDRW